MAPRKASRRRVRSPSPPPPPPPEPTRHEIFTSSRHVEPAWVDRDVLDRTGIYDAVRELLESSGWPGLLDLSCEADKEDTCEFLGTFQLELHSPRRFSYHHRGEKYTCTFEELRAIFGWPSNGTISTMTTMDEGRRWRQLTGYSGYRPSRSISRCLQEPRIFYLQFALARTVFARKNGADKVSKIDLGVLDLIASGEVVDWAYYFCKHIETLRLGAPVAIGGMVTYILRARHPESGPEDHTILDKAWMNYSRFFSGQHIRKRRDGSYQWIYHEDEGRKSPSTPPRGPGRPRGSGKAQLDDEMQQLEVGEPSHMRGAAMEQAQIDAAFNAMRQIIMGAPLVDPLPAPPGWRPEHVVPAEYLHPYFPPPGPF